MPRMKNEEAAVINTSRGRMRKTARVSMGVGTTVLIDDTRKLRKNVSAKENDSMYVESKKAGRKNAMVGVKIRPKPDLNTKARGKLRFGGRM